jgi:hypothetical protein
MNHECSKARWTAPLSRWMMLPYMILPDTPDVKRLED